MNLVWLLYLVFCALYPSYVFALEKDFFSDTPLRNDFVLQPARVELVLAPGESKTRDLFVTNRLGNDAVFSLVVEDFAGSPDPLEGLRLLTSAAESGGVRIDFPESEFVLRHGERAHIPVTVSASESAPAGGVFKAVLAEVAPGGGGGAKISSRAGALFFIRVNGNGVVEGGALESFVRKNNAFHILFKNTGNVHINPYGVIEVTSWFGKIKEIIEVDPYFVLPDSTRLRVVVDPSGFPFGRYRAQLRLNRGYKNIVDAGAVVFWIIPREWKMIGALIVGVGLALAAYEIFAWKKTKKRIQKQK